MKRKKYFLTVCFILIGLIGYSQAQTCNSVTNDTPTPTLDNDVLVETTIIIEDDLILSEMTMDIEITHTYIGDVKFNLVSPAGTSLIISQGLCGDGMNMDCTFTDNGAVVECAATPPAVSGDILPLSNFSNLYGESSLGTWTLEVMDTGPGDTGTINSWTLNYCGEMPLDVNEHNFLDSISIYPIPASERIQISISNSATDEINLTINDLTGRLIDTRIIQGTEFLNLENYTPGIYFANFEMKDQKKSVRFIVK